MLEEGIIIDVKVYSNSSLIVKIFSKEGKKTGFIKGGLKLKNKITIASLVYFKISKRLEEHLGSLKIEVVKSFALLNIKNRLKTCLINCILEVIFFFVQEEIPEPELYEEMKNLLELMEKEENFILLLQKYALFEVKLLFYLGFGMDFSICAMTGSKENLFFLSPITGKCASFEAAKDFKEKLFELPKLYGNKMLKTTEKEDVINALRINLHFFSTIHNFEKLFLRRNCEKLIFSVI